MAGREIPRWKFNYNRRNDRLAHDSRKLSSGKRYVRIVATDKANNGKARVWYFRIVR